MNCILYIYICFIAGKNICKETIYRYLNHPKQAITGTHYFSCERAKQHSMLRFLELFKATASVSLSAEMGSSAGIMDIQIGLNVSTRPSKGKFLHSHSQRWVSLWCPLNRDLLRFIKQLQY